MQGARTGYRRAPLIYSGSAMKPCIYLRRLVVIAAAGALLAGCVYKVNIYQGWITDPGDIDKVEMGMTREQVAYLLGTPTVRDPFHADRWDYVFTPGTLEGERRIVMIEFSDEGVSSIEITPLPAG
ncbi:MAG: outer membrane protein assembly factor BamE [Gammaproteobacteria bacterium]|nr:outer membrane protein assembly factor BamE [Gammaproteobacteria bacterium]MYF66831.1 outer membrane protein assembly factor BamE [Gammaproteobacteria bacterium]MYK36263.1 outer membrane protein assembly factor BamE [Gammaproteobacteria bacterium]